jgi:uroporphyrinogen decarboxylase
VFKAPEDVEHFLESDFPDPNAPGRDFGAKYLANLNQNRRALGVQIRDAFAHVWEALTPVRFVRWTHTNPDTVSHFIDSMARFNDELIDVYGELGIDLIIVAGDLCDAKGPMLSPEQFRNLGILECLKRHVQAAHRHGLKLIKHTDGYVVPLLHDLVDIAGIDGLHSLDPSARVDIGAVKKAYRNRLILHGNVSVDNLATKTKADIVEETIHLIRCASPGGGHILSSSNSWYGGVKLENCYAMVETARKHGRYPLKV